MPTDTWNNDRRNKRAKRQLRRRSIREGQKLRTDSSARRRTDARSRAVVMRLTSSCAWRSVKARSQRAYCRRSAALRMRGSMLIRARTSSMHVRHDAGRAVPARKELADHMHRSKCGGARGKGENANPAIAFAASVNHVNHIGQTITESESIATT